MEVEKTMKAYPNLSRPIKIGNVTIKNRMFMAPMDTGFGNNSYGGLTQAGVEYFVRRAEGGFGLIFSGGTSPDNKVDVSESILNHEKEFVQIGRALNERLRAFGTKMFTQLSMNIGRNAGMKSPSVLPVLGNPSIKTQALTIEEIKTKISEIGKAAKLCKEAGYAGVEIHALHWGHLIDSFALAFMNHRTDEYGGNLENRLRVVKEIREAIASECGKEYPVSIRFAVRSFMKDFDKASFDRKDEVGRTLEEAIEIAKLLEEYGYDALSTDAGTLDAFYYAMPPSYVEMGYTLEYVKEIKKVVNIPVFAGSRMADPDSLDLRYLGIVQVAGVNEVTALYEVLDCLPDTIRPQRSANNKDLREAIRLFSLGRRDEAVAALQQLNYSGRNDYVTDLYLDYIRNMSDDDKGNVFRFVRK